MKKKAKPLDRLIQDPGNTRPTTHQGSQGPWAKEGQGQYPPHPPTRAAAIGSSGMSLSQVVVVGGSGITEKRMVTTDDG